MAGLFHRMYKRWIQNIVPPRAPNCKHGVPIYEKNHPLPFSLFALLAAAAPLLRCWYRLPRPHPQRILSRRTISPPAATPQPLPTMPPSNAQNDTTVPDAALAAADITLYDADTETNRVVSVRDFLIGAAACEMPPTWNDDTPAGPDGGQPQLCTGAGGADAGQFGPSAPGGRIPRY